ncbi:BrnA antitoxin family protein [Ancylobacter sp. GSK1Z-4-2]|nr:BrnA antitoxin family protein [Ancylobacter mangrovi]
MNDPETKTKWAAARERALRSLEAITPEEDAAITAAAEADPDNPPVPDEMIARMRPSAEVAPDFVAAVKRARGRQKAPTKEAVKLRLSPDVLAHFRATGPGWQTRIDETLKRAIGKN